MWSSRILPEQRREADPDQQTFGAQEAAYRLAPGFSLVFDEHAIALPLQHCRCDLDTFNVELEPGLRGRCVGWPGVGAEAGERSLRKRPEGEGLCALQGLGVEIAVAFFLERDAKSAAIERFAFGAIGDDRAKPGDEEDLDAFWGLHAASDQGTNMTSAISGIFSERRDEVDTPSAA